MVFTKRFFLAMCAAAILIPLGGCRHRCCSSPSASYAPPPAACCGPAGLPPAGF